MQFFKCSEMDKENLDQINQFKKIFVQQGLFIKPILNAAHPNNPKHLLVKLYFLKCP